MSSKRWFSVLLAALVLPLFLAIPASAATSSQGNSAGTVLYNAGDHDLTYGPNSFIIRDSECDRYLLLLSYSWDGGTDTESGRCGAERVISIEPLGSNAHPLRWRTCWTDLRARPIMTQCRPYVDDFVFSD
ncbi:hypothetical protein [Actinophytocola sp.]|uniref:hypothetical protein n=1 Tax=Actinophytocola sp. TaxID=1872138 RepID=UPI002ED4D7C9